MSLWIVIAADATDRLAHPAGAIGGIVYWTGRAAIGWWGLDEISRGVNPFRRALGVAVLAAAIVGAF